MQKRSLRPLFSLTIITGLFLTSCGVQTTQLNNLSEFVPSRVSVSSCNYGGEIKSVASVDESTVQFTLCSADAAFPAKMASPILAIQEKKFLDANHGDSISLSNKINGTGPYTLVLNDQNGIIQLKASPDYWGVPPSAQLLDFTFMHSPVSGPLTSEYSVSDVTSTFNLNGYAKEKIFTNAGLNEISHTPLNVVYLGFSNKIKPFDDPVVRQAISTAINRDGLVKSFFPSGSKTANQVIPWEINPGHSDNLDWYELDPNNAENLLANEGFNFSQQLTLAYVSGPAKYIDSYDSMAAEIKVELAASRLRVVLQPMSQQEFDQAMASGSAMMFLNSFSALYPDGAAFYEIPFLRQTSQFGDTYPDIQIELNAVQSELNPIRRQAKFDLLNQTFKEQVPFMPIGAISDWSFFTKGLASASVNGDFENLASMANNGNPIIVLEVNRPVSFWPADETDFDTFRITSFLYDTLVDYGNTTGSLKPGLADSWQSNSDATQWTFTLRYGVKFTNGAVLDSNDVVASFAAIWNTVDNNHKGRSGDFTIFQELFGPLANAR